MPDAGKSLDDVLGKGAKTTTTKAAQLPVEVADAINFMRIEQVLIALITGAGNRHTQTLELIKQLILTGAEGEKVKAEAPRMEATRLALTQAINDLSAFATDPPGWLASARASGRIAEWKRFGIE